MPLFVIDGLAWLSGHLLYLIPNREKQNAKVNIKLAFPQLTMPEQKKLLKQTLIDNSVTLFEMPSIWLGSSEKWKSITDSKAVINDLKKILAEGNGLILAVPHLGNWELNSHIVTELGSVTALYRPPRQTWLEEPMTKGREQSGLKTVPIGIQGVKALYKELAAGNTCLILPDQQPKKRDSGSVFAPFFGKPALTMTLVNRMASKTKSPVYFLSSVRVRGKYRFQIFGHRANNLIQDKDLSISVAELNAGIEVYARQFPSQYQWTYRRFEAQPNDKKIAYK